MSEAFGGPQPTKGRHRRPHRWRHPAHLASRTQERAHLPLVVRLRLWTPVVTSGHALTMTNIPLADAKASGVVSRVSKHHERVTVTVHGQPSAVLLSPDDLAMLEETIAVLGDTDLMIQARRGRGRPGRRPD